MCFIQEFMVNFWNPKIWLPPGITWEDIKSNDKQTYAESRDLLVAIPAAVVLLLVRYLVEKGVLYPFGAYLGISKPTVVKPPQNDVLESFYRRKSKLEYSDIVNLANELGWTARRIQRWFRTRRAADKAPLLKKFSECIWKFLYYTYSFLYGVGCLWDKPWLWDINHCWYNYPFHPVTWDCWLYYVQSLTFYVSATATHFFDVKRKDFWQMLAHHVLTIALLCFSWNCHFHRIGTLVLLVHDCADIFVESTKAAKFAGYQRLSDVLFVMLTITWMVGRIVMYPLWILHSSLIEAPKIVAMNPTYYIFGSMLITLAILNFLWGYVILNMAICMYKAGQMVKDLRSSTEADISDEINFTVEVIQRSRKRIVVDDVDGNQEPEEAVEPETQVSQPTEAAAGSSNKDELDKRVKQMQVEAESRKNEFAKLLEEHAQVIKELKQMEDEPPAPGAMQA